MINNSAGFFSSYLMLCFFQLNIGCTNQYSSSAPVLLQYSHDAGLFWSLVKEGCYPASPGTKGCEGSSRELSEPTVYHTGDFEDWTRITIVIPRSLAARYPIPSASGELAACRLRLLGKNCKLWVKSVLKICRSGKKTYYALQNREKLSIFKVSNHL